MISREPAFQHKKRGNHTARTNGGSRVGSKPVFAVGLGAEFMLAVRGTVSAGLEVGTNALLFAVGRPGSWFVALKSASELAPRASACTDHRSQIANSQSQSRGMRRAHVPSFVV